MPALITYNGKSVINNNPYITPMDVGAYSVFTSMHQLNNLPSERRKAGMMVYILETNDFFVLKNSSWEFRINDWWKHLFSKILNHLRTSTFRMYVCRESTIYFIS